MPRRRKRRPDGPRREPAPLSPRRDDGDLAEFTAPTPDIPPADGPQRARASDRPRFIAYCSVLREPFAVVFKPVGANWHLFEAQPLRGTPRAKSDAPPASEKKIRLRGNIFRTREYPGCPYCQAESVICCPTCTSYICTGAAKVTNDNKTYCPVCDVRLVISAGGLSDAMGNVAPPSHLELPGLAQRQLADQSERGIKTARSIGEVPPSQH
jgi:hypothetical protein